MRMVAGVMSRAAGISIVNVLPRPGSLVDVHDAAMRLDDRLHNAQSESAAARVAREPLIGLVKALEDAPALMRREADAVVLDGEAHAAVAALDVRRAMRLSSPEYFHALSSRLSSAVTSASASPTMGGRFGAALRLEVAAGRVQALAHRGDGAVDDGFADGAARRRTRTCFVRAARR